MNECCKDICNSIVKETRQSKDGYHIKRRRECLVCHMNYATFECSIIEFQDIITSAVNECGPKLAKTLQDQTNKTVAYHIRAMYRTSKEGVKDESVPPEM